MTTQTIRLLDLYWIPVKKEFEKITNFYEDIIKMKQERNIKNRQKEIFEYYKKRKSNREEYILAYN